MNNWMPHFDKLIKEWRPVVGFEGLYEVSSFGTVRRVADSGSNWAKHEHWIKKPEVSKGYLRITLCKDNGNGKHKHVHNIVAEAFIGPCPPGWQVNHQDGKKFNNRADNLEYVTRSENRLHAFRIGLQHGMKGSASPVSKLTDDQVRTIRARYASEKITQTELGREFGVTGSLVCMIVSGKRWPHLMEAAS